MTILSVHFDLEVLLERTAALHRHLCPRQVLGVRMGMFAGEILPLELPQNGKRLLTFVETDGCFSDGVSVATGCSIGHRTMRVVDYGKVAATFVDSVTGRAWRICPSPIARTRAAAVVPEAASRDRREAWHTRNLLCVQRRSTQSARGHERWAADVQELRR